MSRIYFLQLFLVITLLSQMPQVSFAQKSAAASITIAPGVSFRGISAVSDKVCWVSGSKGNVWRTTDGGKKWSRIPTPAGDSLDYRDVQAFSNTEAWIMSAGEGPVSRIYHTTDAGRNWTLQLQMKEPKGFFDGFAFWDAQHAILVGDPVQGNVFDVYTTTDGGSHWNRVPAASLPQNREGEYAFAASGTCVAVAQDGNAWIGTGGGAARVFHTTDMGKTWTATDTPVLHGKPSQGIFSVCFWDTKGGIIGGGDYEKADTVLPVSYQTNDGGATWSPMKASRFLSCVAVNSVNHVEVGSSHYLFGLLSGDKTGTTEGFHTASLAPGGLTIFAAGGNGRVIAIHPGAKDRKLAKQLEKQGK